MKKPYTSIALLTILVSGVLFASFNLGSVSAASDVTGRINQDTTWTKTGSPYTLTGNLLVSTGVTLTIEAGVTVNLNSYLMMVNGTLQSKGSSSDKIQFNGGTLTITQASSGCVIENTNFDSAIMVTFSGAPKINGCSFQGGLSMGGNTTFTNNSVEKRVDISGSPTVTGSTFKGLVSLNSDAFKPLISYNTLLGGIGVNYQADVATISHNTISGDLSVYNGALSIIIDSNQITGTINIGSDKATITNNDIKGSITTSATNIIISDNKISQTDTGITLTPKSPVGFIDATISGNTISARQTGIMIAESYSVSFYGWYTIAVVSGNTITGCANAGISVGGGTGQYGYSTSGNNVTVLNNRFFGNNYAINARGSGRIEGNTIVGNYFGISSDGVVIGNIVANNTYGILSGGTVENNFVAKNKVGVMGYNIITNTIINNGEGVHGFGELHYNNIYGNTLNVNYTAATDGNATSNWWGTTDAAAISQLIRDYDEDFLLGRVSYTPFLTALNQNAPSPNTEIPPIDSPISQVTPTPTQTTVKTTPTPTQTTTQTTNPTPTSTTNPTNSAPTTPQPTIPEFPIAAPLLIAAIAATLLAAATIAKVQRKQTRHNQ